MTRNGDPVLQAASTLHGRPRRAARGEPRPDQEASGRDHEAGREQLRSKKQSDGGALLQRIGVELEQLTGQHHKACP